MVEKAKWIWQNGKLVPWDEAKVHVLTHALHYGFAAFEGIRSYQLDDGGCAVFRLDSHIRRLYESCKILGIKPPVGEGELRAASFSVLSENGFKEAYIRPIIYMGYGAIGLYAVDNPVGAAVAAFPWGAYLGNDGLRNGIRATVSSYTRNHPNAVMAKGKICGHYVNNILAKVEAMSIGCQEAIMLDTEGYVAEGSGENIFLVRNGTIFTPPVTSLLEGITRDSAITLAKDLDFPLVERRLGRDELYIAEELFMTGTAAEVTPIKEVDGRQVGDGKPGPVTRRIQDAFFDAVKGRNSKYHAWLSRLQ